MDFTDTTIMDENEVVAETTTEFSDPAKDELVYLPIEKLYPHPDNPRKELGDLTELADNIKQTRKILQNLVVVEWPDEVSGKMRYRIIAGHRRRAAAEIAGLTELPCVIVDLTPEEQIEAMMNENVHRKNLNIIEQAQGFQLMLENVGSVEEVSRRTGFSRSTVSNRVKYTRLDQEKLKKATTTRQVSFTDLNKLNEVDDIDERNNLLDVIGTDNFIYRLRTVLNKQEAKKKKAMIKPLLRKMGFKPKKCDRYEYGKPTTLNKNELIVEELTEEAISEFVKKHGYPDGEQIYYCVFDNNGDTFLFNDLPEPTVSEKAKKAAEEAKKAKMEELANKFLELETAAFQCRKDFVANCTPTVIKKNLKALTLLLDYSHFRYCSFDRSLYYELLGIDKAEGGSIDRETVSELVGNSPEKSLLFLVYCNLRDSEKENYRGYQLSFSMNKDLEMLYDTLVALGYTPSDDETALRNGTHPLYAEAAALTETDTTDSDDDGDDVDDEYDEDYEEEYDEYEDEVQEMDGFPFGGSDEDEEEEELLAS